LGLNPQLRRATRREGEGMNILRPIMLGTIAAFATMACVGASSASAATHEVIQLCKAQELLLCATTNLIKHPLKGRFLDLAGKGTFKGLFTITCTSGMGDSNEFAFGEKEIKEELVALTFTGCEGGCTKVEVKTAKRLIHTDLNLLIYRRLTHEVKVKFTGCTFGVTCTFEGNLNLEIRMDAEGMFVDAGKENQSFKFVEGTKAFCGETGVWNEGITRLDWRLDDGVKQPDGTLGTIHKAYLTSLEKLTEKTT
jgi:hypothetical protein